MSKLNFGRHRVTQPKALIAKSKVRKRRIQI